MTAIKNDGLRKKYFCILSPPMEWNTYNIISLVIRDLRDQGLYGFIGDTMYIFDTAVDGDQHFNLAIFCMPVFGSRGS